MDDSLRKAALDYHRFPTPGKISIAPTKGLINQRDLALAYTPGVAAACEAIVADPAQTPAFLAEARGMAQEHSTNDLHVRWVMRDALDRAALMRARGNVFQLFS